MYIGSEDSQLYAFDTATGKPLWTALTGGEIEYSSPSVAKLYMWGQITYAFNAMTGQPIWSVATGNFTWSSPAVADGVVYVASVDTNLYAFSAATGQQLWKAATGGQIYCSPAVANGFVYVGSGSLYAFALPFAEPPGPPEPATLQPDLNLLLHPSNERK